MYVFICMLLACWHYLVVDSWSCICVCACVNAPVNSPWLSSTHTNKSLRKLRHQSSINSNRLAHFLNVILAGVWASDRRQHVLSCAYFQLGVWCQSQALPGNRHQIVLAQHPADPCLLGVAGSVWSLPRIIGFTSRNLTSNHPRCVCLTSAWPFLTDLTVLRPVHPAPPFRPSQAYRKQKYKYR